ncbi:MAG: hypothetical protein J7M15_04920, partial [Anaerolineae bacterium]|nr:hypothetical protein [Anaerolineae bacterium]
MGIIPELCWVQTCCIRRFLGVAALLFLVQKSVLFLKGMCVFLFFSADFCSKFKRIHALQITVLFVLFFVFKSACFGLGGSCLGDGDDNNRGIGQKKYSDVNSAVKNGYSLSKGAVDDKAGGGAGSKKGTGEIEKAET